MIGSVSIFPWTILRRLLLLMRLRFLSVEAAVGPGRGISWRGEVDQMRRGEKVWGNGEINLWIRRLREPLSSYRCHCVGILPKRCFGPRRQSEMLFVTTLVNKWPNTYLIYKQNIWLDKTDSLKGHVVSPLVWLYRIFYSIPHRKSDAFIRRKRNLS